MAIVGHLEKEISLNDFPSPETLWRRYMDYIGFDDQGECIYAHDYYQDSIEKKLRYYQQIAINRAMEHIAMGQNRILLVMATGTGERP